MRPRTASLALERLRARLREAGLRSTGPRLSVLRVLEGATSPMSHAEVHEALQGEGLDRATVYRNLMDLTDVGLLSRSDVGDHVWRFELRGEGAAHPNAHAHFVCVDCGDVSCLPDKVVRIVASGSGVPKSLEQRRVEVQVKGVCDRCG